MNAVHITAVINYSHMHSVLHGHCNQVLGDKQIKNLSLNQALVVVLALKLHNQLNILLHNAVLSTTMHKQNKLFFLINLFLLRIEQLIEP